MHRVSLLQKTLINNTSSNSTTCLNRHLYRSFCKRNATTILRNSSSKNTSFISTLKNVRASTQYIKPAAFITTSTTTPTLFSAFTFGVHVPPDKKKAIRLGSADQPATPSEIEFAELNHRSKYKLVRICQCIIKFLDDWILEPVLTIRRLTHILLLFIPVALTVPVVFFGHKVEGDKDDNNTGTLWWFDFLAIQMERAGPTFIKVRRKE